jgi:hypothetical protein
MSYQGFVGLMTDYCEVVYNTTKRKVKIIEIGVDRGQTALPLLHNLVYRKIDFQWVGIDIKADTAFAQSQTQMEGIRIAGATTEDITDCEYQSTPNLHYIIMNSLDWLPVCCEVNRAAEGGVPFVDPRSRSMDDRRRAAFLLSSAPNFFDLVLLDGDHNYNTVKKELEYLTELTHDGSLIFVDDYHGRHAGKDSFYKEYKEHKDIEHRDIKRNDGREGVNNAVTDFIKEHNEHISSSESFAKWNVRNLRELCPVGEAALITRNIVPVTHIKRTMRNDGKEINILHRWCQNYDFININDNKHMENDESVFEILQ